MKSTVIGKPSDRPAELHPDLNLSMRGYAPTGGHLGLINVEGPTDPRAPQLAELVPREDSMDIVALYRVREWDWDLDRAGGLIHGPSIAKGLVVQYAFGSWILWGIKERGTPNGVPRQGRERR